MLNLMNALRPMWRASRVVARCVHTRAAPKILTAYSFAAKPREPQVGPDGKRLALRGQIERDSELWRWRNEVLQGGDAGEDSVVVVRSADERTVVMAVADGVGGWVEQGIEPAKYANGLLYYLTRAINSADAVPQPLALLQYAFDHTQADAGIEAGSSTACIVRLDAAKGIIGSANLGDSGYVVLRPDAEGRLQSVYVSPAQQYGFNCPYQMSKSPPEFAADSITNFPRDAELREHELRPGDMVLVATDGFFDNVHCKLPPREALTPDAPLRPELLQLLDLLQDKHKEHWQDSGSGDALERPRDFVRVVSST